MRKNYVQFRVTKDERDQIEAAAKSAGLGSGPFARRAVLSGLDMSAATAQIHALSTRLDALQEAIEVLAGLVADEAKKGADLAANGVFENRTKPLLIQIAGDLQKAMQKAIKEGTPA